MAGFSQNVVVISGNLTRDPETRALPSGMSVVAFRLAHNDRRKNKQTGHWDDVPMYFDVTMFGGVGDALARDLSKGDPVSFQGKLQWREWSDKEGNKRQSVDILADAGFKGARGGNGGQREGYGDQGDYGQGYGSGYGQQATQAPQQSYQQSPGYGQPPQGGYGNVPQPQAPVQPIPTDDLPWDDDPAPAGPPGLAKDDGIAF